MFPEQNVILAEGNCSFNILYFVPIQIFEQIQIQIQFYFVFKYSSNIMCAHRLVNCPTQLTVIFMLFYFSQDKYEYLLQHKYEYLFQDKYEPEFG